MGRLSGKVALVTGAASGIGRASAEALARGENGLDALVEGISRVEREVTVRSVGYGGWPNMLALMEQAKPKA